MLFDGFPKEYLDPYSWVTTRPGHHSENGQLFTAHLIVLKCLIERPSSRTRQTLREEWESLLKGTEIEPGLYQRSPVHTKQNSVDNYIGICSSAGFLYSDKAEDVWEYGKRHAFFYSNTGKDTVNSFMGRYVGLLVHIRESMKVDPGGLLRWTARVSMDSSWVDTDHSSNKLLGFQIAATSRDKKMKELFWELMKRDGLNLEKLFKEYFKDSHPLCDLAREANRLSI